MQAFFGDCAHPHRSSEVGVVLFRTLVDGTVAVLFTPFSSFGSGDTGRPSMMEDKEVLNKVCRGGGRKFSSLSRSTTYSAREYAAELRSCFGINVDDDQNGVHPPFICTLCWRVLSRCREAITAGRSFSQRGGGCGITKVWTAHTGTNSECCAGQPVARGRPKKRRRFLAVSGGPDAEPRPKSPNVPTSPPSDGTRCSACQSSNSASPLAELVKKTGQQEDSPTGVDDLSLFFDSFSDSESRAGHDHNADSASVTAKSKLMSQREKEASVRVGTDIPFADLLCIATPNYKSNDHDSLLSPDRLPFACDDLLCSVCRHIANQAVEVPCCQQIFCAECLWAWLVMSAQCPTCRKDLVASQAVQLHPRLAGVLSQMQISCNFASTASETLGCQQKVPLCKLQSHTAKCPFRPGAASHESFNHILRPSSSVKEILSMSATDLKGDVAVQLTSHLVSAQQNNGVLEVRNGSHGKAQTWLRVTNARMPSSAVADSTVRKRSHEISMLRQSVSGGSSGSSVQLTNELQRLKRDEQDTLLQEAGLSPRGCAGHGVGLALKADLHLPRFQLRKLRRWLKSFGVFLDSEAAMRQQISKELPFELSAKLLPLTDKGGAVSLKPAVYFPDLVALVLHYLNEHKHSNTLVWHDGAIPSDEVWVKLGGDHGGGSFKFSFQIANTAHPNALQNTVPFLVFAAPDSFENLATTLNPFADQVKMLMGTTWDSRYIRCIFFGDYELLCACYGLSGPSGRRPCLFCLSTKAEMQLPPTQQPAHEERSLQRLNEDLKRFEQNGSCLAHAKLFNNVIRPSLLPIPLEWVCIPALHLDLGIYGWMFESFISDMRQLDAMLAARVGTSGLSTTDGAAFAEAVERNAKLDEKSKLSKQLEVQINTVQSQVRKGIFTYPI